jgi:arylsulfatase A-like enzyme
MGPDGKLGTSVKKGFSTDVFAGSAIDFIDKYAAGDKGKPFFCYVAFTVPHDPYSPHNDYVNRYDPDSIPLPGNYMPLHPFAFDDLLVRDENLLPWPRPAEKVKEVLADYYALITHLDSRIGDIFKALKENELFDNTIIVYAADNGLAAGSHGLLGKQNLYEHSMKVPLIISGPGIPEGKVSDALVYLFDLYPTLSELSHLTFPENIDGKSLVPVISGRSTEVRSSLFTAYRNTVRAVRTKEWKLIRYPKRDYTQLFNLATDPFEMNNLSGVEQYDSKVDELLKLMTEWQGMVKDTVPLKAERILPLQYDHTKLVRKPDQWQPDYTVRKYFDPAVK